MKMKLVKHSLTVLAAAAATMVAVAPAHAADKKPNIVILMTDDTGWADFGCISGGGATLGPSDAEHRPYREGRNVTSPVGMGRRVAPLAAARS